VFILNVTLIYINAFPNLIRNLFIPSKPHITIRCHFDHGFSSAELAIGEGCLEPDGGAGGDMTYILINHVIQAHDLDDLG